MSSNKKYWKAPEQIQNPAKVDHLEKNEFVEPLPTDVQEDGSNSSTTRRDFLKYVGFSTAAATIAACEGPVIHSIPYAEQPERIVPGKSDYYATSMADGFDFAGVLVKTREGRPIKIENNELVRTTSASKARVHASILSMYDVQRLQKPEVKGEQRSWVDFHLLVKDRLRKLNGKPIVFLTQTFASPATKKLIREFKKKYPSTRHVVYDAVSESAGLDAFEEKFGLRALPQYDLSNARNIISIGADLLGDWQGGGSDRGYARSRKPSKEMSRHYQFEANLSLSGGNADYRVPAKPSTQKRILVELYNRLVNKTTTVDLPKNIAKMVDQAVNDINKSKSRSVVITGIQDKNAQRLAMEINMALNSELMDVDDPKMIREGNDAEVMKLVSDMNQGNIGALITAGVNPAYSLPNADAFKKGTKNLDLMVSCAMKKDETASLAEFVAATPHYLESWGDVQFSKKEFSLCQPTIKPIFNTMQFQDCVLNWLGKEETYYDFLKNYFDTTYQGLSWNQCLHDGVYRYEKAKVEPSSSTVSFDAGQVCGQLASSSPKGFELALYTKIGMGDGQQANNPWLQEFPDPITRNTWDNYITVSKRDAEELGIENRVKSNGAIDGDLVNIKVGDRSLNNVPIFVQPGQAPGSLGLALGFGRKSGLNEEMQVGLNAYPLYQNFKFDQSVRIEKTEGNHEFACLQLQNTMAGREDIIRETDLDTYLHESKEEWNKTPEFSKDHSMEPVDSKKVDLWTSFDRSIGHHFKLSIDLNSCTGCGACVIACHSENNVPVVGKEEVRKSRNMHWLRIDRYYSSGDSFDEEKEKLKNLGTFETYKDVETASYDNPQVAFQPVMCQHCNHAPCETVCPVGAIGHGRQGQNQMTYNRCIGTRYCANNCPYKVRRFNWFRYNQNDEFDYHMNNDLGRMVLNPDVTVRSRGVMEKCSFCIQMTQKSILDAKREGRPVKDEEFQTACANACDTGALTFGDVNDKKSEVFEESKDERMYHLLGYLGVEPNVMYQTKVNNKNKTKEKSNA